MAHQVTSFALALLLALALVGTDALLLKTPRHVALPGASKGAAQGKRAVPMKSTPPGKGAAPVKRAAPGKRALPSALRPALGKGAVPVKRATPVGQRRTPGVIAFRGGDAPGGGGACGFQPGFPPPGIVGLFVASVSPAIGGINDVCGQCFQVQCLGVASCNQGKSVTVVVTNACAGRARTTNASAVAPCARPAFSLQAEAYDVISNDPLAVTVPAAFRAVPCPLRGGVQVLVQVGNDYILQVSIQNVAGPGALRAVQVSTGGPYVRMARVNGVLWQVLNVPIAGRFLSFRLTGHDWETLVLPNVVPPGFKANFPYSSRTNFPVAAPQRKKGALQR